MRGRQRAVAQAADRVAEVQALPRVGDAELLDAQRVAVVRDVPVAMPDGGTRGAREALDLAEAEVADAAAAAACFVGLAARGLVPFSALI